MKKVNMYKELYY